MDEMIEIDKPLLSNTRALLVSSPKGVPINQFNSDYRKLIGRFFPFRAHGFTTTMELLKIMEKKGVLRIEPSHKPQDGGWRIYGIPDTNHFVPSWFMKNAHNHVTNRSSNSMMTSDCGRHGNVIVKKLSDFYDDDDETKHYSDQLQRDVNGLVSVHVQWKCQNSTGDMQNMKQIIFRLMSQVGTPEEIVFMDNYAFVRFKSLIEAENAILRLNHREIETYRFTIKPAVPKKYPQKTNEPFSKPKIPEKSLEHLIGAPLYEGHTNSVLNNSHDVTSLVAGGYEEAAIDSDSDCEWDDSLLQMSSVNISDCINSSDCVSWSDIVTQFTGSVSWDTRTTQLCGNNLAVNIVHNTLLQQDCVYWIQVLESQEMKCFRGLQEYASCLTLSSLTDSACMGEVYGYSTTNSPVSRGAILEEGRNPRLLNIDNGKVVSVSETSLRVLPKWFSEFPMMAIPCQVSESSNVNIPQNGFGRANITIPNTAKSRLPLPLKIEFTNEDFYHSNNPSPLHTVASSLSFCTNTTIKSPYPSPSMCSTHNILWTFNQPCTTNGLTSVYVSEVVSPGCFWVQVTIDPNQDLKWMSERIEESVTIPEQQISVGVVCGYKNNTLNYRVIIECFTNYEKTQVNVLCMDTGVKLNQVCINSLYSLSSILTNKPPLVIRCKLHGVISTRADGLWWIFDNQLLWGTIRNQMVYVKFPFQFKSSDWLVQRIEDPLSLSVYMDKDGWDNVNEILAKDGHFIALDPSANDC